jgi:hypothetical protein
MMGGGDCELCVLLAKSHPSRWGGGSGRNSLAAVKLLRLNFNMYSLHQSHSQSLVSTSDWVLLNSFFVFFIG